MTVIKSRTKGWSWHIVGGGRGEKKIAYKVLVGKPERKGQLGRLRNRCEIIIKWILKKMS
jgi:hypothetical protein